MASSSRSARRPALGWEALAAGPPMLAEGVRMAVRPVPDEEPEVVAGKRRREADLGFELEQGPTVGHRGFYICDD